MILFVLPKKEPAPASVHAESAAHKKRTEQDALYEVPNKHR